MYSSHCFFRASRQMKQLLVISHKDGIPRQPKLSAMPVTSPSAVTPRCGFEPGRSPPRPRQHRTGRANKAAAPGQCGGARPPGRGGSAHAPAGPARPGPALAPAGPGALSPGPGAAARSGRRHSAPRPGHGGRPPAARQPRRSPPRLPPLRNWQRLQAPRGDPDRGPRAEAAEPRRRCPASRPPTAPAPGEERGRPRRSPAPHPARPGPAAPPRCAPRAPRCPARAWRFLPRGTASLRPPAAAGGPKRRLLQHPGLGARGSRGGTLHPCPDLRLSSGQSGKELIFSSNTGRTVRCRCPCSSNSNNSSTTTNNDNNPCNSSNSTVINVQVLPGRCGMCARSESQATAREETLCCLRRGGMEGHPERMRGDSSREQRHAAAVGNPCLKLLPGKVHQLV
ncbi:uncharacterized protein GJ701_017264 [Geothlypis trichas]